MAKKQEAVASKVATSKASNESEPPSKKRKTGKQVKGSTVVKSMKVAELKEEAENVKEIILDIMNRGATGEF